MAKPFFRLRMKMAEQDVTQQELGRRIGRSASYVIAALTGKGGWDSRDIPKVARALNIPRDEWTDLFFPDQPPVLQVKGGRAG